MKRTLNEISRRIEEQVPYVDVKLYSHNIISLLLSQAASEHGRAAANKLIEKHRLEELGWRRQPEK